MRQRGVAVPTHAGPVLVRALARARASRFQRLLNEGRYASISEMAAADSERPAGPS